MLFLERDFPVRRVGVPRVASKELVREGVPFGRVEMETSDELIQQKILKDRQAYALLLMTQFALSLALILWAISARLFKPLRLLSAFSSKLARGNLECPLDNLRHDELGQLAQELDQMRVSLRTTFDELQATLANIPVGVAFIQNGTIKLSNPKSEEILGYLPGELKGISPRHFFRTASEAKSIEIEVCEAFDRHNGRFSIELILKRRNGEPFWGSLRGVALDANSPQRGSFWVLEDVTERKATESAINNLAYFDSLTQLPNRRRFLDRLKQARAASARHHRGGALLFLDLDDFKSLNDTLGHDIGDLLLQQVAFRLLACVRREDTVARMGGDEFVVLIEDLSPLVQEAAEQARAVGETILEALNHPYQLNQYEYFSSPSIGISLFSEPLQSSTDSSGDDLLKQADIALYQAKGGGRNTLRFFDPDMQAAAALRASLESGLREALQKKQFELHYQPQIDDQGRYAGAEALLRWQHPERGMIFPSEFVALAEDTGLILPIGEWVLETACRQLVTWAMGSATDRLTIAVNVSARQLHDRNFVETVLSVLERTGANPRLLKLELTESLLVNEVEEVIAKMLRLRDRGVGFALDDFGTGYSSLTYLKRLPLDHLKIDQSFVRDILTDGNDATIAKMVIVLADSMGLGVIAEGVETQDQRDLLAYQGCYIYQGYLFGRPAPVADFERVMYATVARSAATPVLGLR